MRALLRSLLGLGAALMIPAAASAATCHVTPQAVSFGSYDPIAGASVDGIGSVGVACDEPVDFTIALTAGSGTFEERRMSSGARQLAYNLYTSASRAVVWADGIAGSGVSSHGVTAVDLTIYGRISAGQNVAAGSYSDSLTITLSY